MGYVEPSAVRYESYSAGTLSDGATWRQNAHCADQYGRTQSATQLCAHADTHNAHEQADLLHSRVGDAGGCAAIPLQQQREAVLRLQHSNVERTMRLPE